MPYKPTDFKEAPFSQAYTHEMITRKIKFTQAKKIALENGPGYYEQLKREKKERQRQKIEEMRRREQAEEMRENAQESKAGPKLKDNEFPKTFEEHFKEKLKEEIEPSLGSTFEMHKGHTKGVLKDFALKGLTAGIKAGVTYHSTKDNTKHPSKFNEYLYYSNGGVGDLTLHQKPKDPCKIDGRGVSVAMLRPVNETIAFRGSLVSAVLNGMTGGLKEWQKQTTECHDPKNKLPKL